MTDKTFAVDVQFGDTILKEYWMVTAPDYLRALRKAWELVEENHERLGRSFEFGEFGVTLNEL